MLCPFLSICKSKVNYDQYTNVCSNIAKDAYKECTEYKKLTSEAKTPLDWSRLTTIPTTPT
jgi:hypothetical protein